LFAVLILSCGLLAACGSDSGTVPADEGAPDNGVEVSDSTASDVASDSASDGSSDASTDVSVDDGSNDDAQTEDVPQMPDTSDATSPADVEDASSDTGGALEDIASTEVETLDVVTDEGAPEPDTSADTGPSEPLWLLSIEPVTNILQRVDVETGALTDLCTIDNNNQYPSLTFSREGILFASNNTLDQIDRIDPCTCEVTELPPHGFGFIPGITSDYGTGLFAVENFDDVLLSMNGSTGQGVVIGEFGFDFGTGGATWSDESYAVFAIDGTSDSLYSIDPETGVATLQAQLQIDGFPVDFYTVGIELHPENGVLYACTGNTMFITGADDSSLYTVDPLTGEATFIGPLDQAGSCTNLAAPWVTVDCPNWPE
tara:strand:- start:2156 stop:3271 length:1116 start_codon:yes stop_codon:yes gene_type:complete